MIHLSRRAALGAGTLGVLAAPSLARAQGAAADWSPTGQVRLINGFAPGGSPDILARAMAPHAQAALGQPFVVENRPGAGGSIGARFAAQQPADGHTLFLAAVSAVIGPFMSQNAGYRIEEFRPISLLTITPVVLVVRQDFPAQSIQEFHRVVAGSQNRFTYASAGSGTPHQLAAELYSMNTGAQMTHVPFRGSALALTELRAGRVDMTFVDLASAIGQIRQGGLRALAVTTNRRVPALPDIPTVGETVLPGFEAYTWVMWWVPAATPDPVVRRLNQVALGALQQPDVLARVNEFGFLLEGTDIARAEAHVQSETTKWSALIRARGLRFDEG
jgi:tripartite-type tricarboxylate transporter receptor subunit TctC